MGWQVWPEKLSDPAKGSAPRANLNCERSQPFISRWGYRTLNPTETERKSGGSATSGRTPTAATARRSQPGDAIHRLHPRGEVRPESLRQEVGVGSPSQKERGGGQKKRTYLVQEQVSLVSRRCPRPLPGAQPRRVLLMPGTSGVSACSCGKRL